MKLFSTWYTLWRYYKTRTVAYKVLRHKVFNVAKNPKSYGYQRSLTSMVYNFLDKQTAGGAVKLKYCKTRKLLKNCTSLLLLNSITPSNLSFEDNIWGADLANMQLICFNKRFFLLCFIDIYSKYTRVGALKYKKRITITYVFQKLLDKSRRKPKKILVGKGNKFYKRSIK